jgi:uncharacterized protein (TIGR02099 family)
MQTSDRSAVAGVLLRALEALAWTVFFAFAAVFLALRFWLLPQVENYRVEVEAALTRAAGLQVRIGGLRADWDGLRPRLAVSDLRVLDREGREALVLPAVEPVVAWSTLLAGELRLHSLAIEGPRLTVRRDARGAIHVAGVTLEAMPAAGATGNGRLAGWILEQREIVVRNAEIDWVDELRGAPPLALRALQLRLRNRGDVHQIGLSARPPHELGASVELRASIEVAGGLRFEEWKGRVYAEFGYTDLAGWRAWFDYPVDISAGQGALRLWATFGAGKLADATADVALTGVLARLDRDLPVLAIASVTGRVQGRQTARGYDFGARRLALAPERGAPLSGTSFSASWEAANGAQAAHGAVSADLIELGPLAQLAEYLPFPRDLRSLLAELAPQGRLRDVDFRWSGELPDQARFQARARFDALTMTPWRAIPGFANLSGRVQASETHGELHLAARNAEIGLPKIFPEARIRLDALDGEVRWERTSGAGVGVRLAGLSYANEDFAGSASGNYLYTGEGPGVIDLNAHLSRVNARNLHRYLPLTSIMGERSRAWLAGAIRGGKSNDARLRLLGDLRDFPFVDPAKGQFQIQAQVREATLEYARGWPPAQDIDGALLFERNRMEITGRKARILGASVSNVRVAIAQLGSPGAELLIQGNAEGRTAEFLDYIRQSPVHGMIGGFSDGTSASGSGRLRLKLVLPLAKPDATRVQGEYRFVGNTVHLDPGLPPLEGASGTLSFTERSLTISEASGRIFGGPIALSGGTSRGGDLTVLARGSFSVAGVEPLLGRPWQGVLQGFAPYTATLSTRANRAPRVVFESNLVGVSSDLPPPLAKPANAPLTLRVSAIAGEAGQRIFITLGLLLRAELLRQGEGEKSLERAAVAFSPPAGPLRMPEERGTVLLYGTLGSLDLERWLPLFAGRGGEGLQLRTDLRIGTLDALGKRLSGIAVKAATQKEGWSADLESAQVSGELAYRTADGGKLVARLSRFAIPPDIPGAQAARDLADLPALDLIADSFSLRGKDLGSVQIVAHHAGTDWVLERVAMRNLDSSLIATGLWRTGAGASTSLSVDVEASDVGLMLERFGQPGLVKGGNAKAQASVSWNGGPTAIDYASLTGRVEAHAADGQFLEIDPGVGKLVALMSLQMLPQRITLDFRDVFSKGFKWDRIDATAQIERGVLDTQDFRMRGSAADVVMKGQADLARETQDLLVRVTPKLGDSAATVVGIINPVAGIVTFLGQRVLKDPLGQMFAFEYGITGSWADPKVAKLKPAASAEVPTPPSGN